MWEITCKMIYKVNAQNFISNSAEVAQKKLKNHQEKGEGSNLSIFEVANLMDQVLFPSNNIQSNNQGYFEFCFN